MDATALKTYRLFSRRCPMRRVGLLSPTSGNLGNATMQSAVIANLRKRIPGVEFVGITLNPGETRRRHGIEAFPLAGVSRPNYAVYHSQGSNTRERQPDKLEQVKQRLKKIPGLRGFWRAVRGFNAKLTHIAAAARDNPAGINDGIDLLNGHLEKGDRVTTIANSKPLSFALGLKPARDGPLWWELNFSFNR